jgi:hypothetical protein
MDVNTISNEVKQQIIGEYIKTAAGRAKLAASMTAPLRLRRDYTSVARKAFLVEQLPDGALPIYDKDPNVTAFVVGEEGENILAITKPRRVIFPLFEIASNPELPLTQIRERRFDLIERAQDLGKSQIQAAEDARAFDVLDAVSQFGFDNLGSAYVNAQINAVGPLTPGNLIDAITRIEQHDLRVARIFMNALDAGDLRRWGRDVFDPETQGTLFKTGLIGTAWGAQIIVTRKVNPGYAYVCAEPEFVGRIPVRSDLTVLSADDPKARRIGFSIFEQLGIGCHNPLAITRIKIAR